MITNKTEAEIIAELQRVVSARTNGARVIVAEREFKEEAQNLCKALIVIPLPPNSSAIISDLVAFCVRNRDLYFFKGSKLEMFEDTLMDIVEIEASIYYKL